MSDQITLGNLKIKSRFPIITLQQCHIHARCGEHTEAEILCTVKADEARAVIGSMTSEKLEIVNQAEAEKEEVLFAGIIRKMELAEEGSYAVLKLEALSTTWEMDLERKSRSFQNLAQTYKEIAQEILKEYQGRLIWNVPDRPLTYPLIQYQETDYTFLKRIMSHLGACIIPEDFGEGVVVHVGIRNGVHRGDLAIDRYVHSLIPSKRQQETVISMGNRQLGYMFTGTDFMRVGDVVRIQGMEFQLMETETSFAHNALECTCQAFPPKCFVQEKIPADTLKGAAINGKILETGQELVKMHLEIDREQSVAQAFPFPWRPITGNLFYSMPEPGTRAALYFGQASEESAAVIYNIRENGEVCAETGDYQNRYYTTEHHKRMYLKPSQMGLLNMEEENAEVAFQDDSLVHVRAEHQISVLAEGQVELRGRNVTVSTPKEATLVRKDMLSPTVINLCNAFDAIGKKGNFAASAPVVEKKRKPAAAEPPVEEYQLDGGVMSMMLSNIPMDGEGDAVMEKIAGSMPVGVFRNGGTYE